VSPNKILNDASGWCPADTGDAQQALDAAEAKIVSDCEVAGGGSGAIGTYHGAVHVVGKSFTKAPRCRGGRYGLWPLVLCGREHANVQVSGLSGVRVSDK
jgi:hypothetical protein